MTVFPSAWYKISDGMPLTNIACHHLKLRSSKSGIKLVYFTWKRNRSQGKEFQSSALKSTLMWWWPTSARISMTGSLSLFVSSCLVALKCSEIGWEWPGNSTGHQTSIHGWDQHWVGCMQRPLGRRWCGGVKINKMVRHKLTWFIERVEQSNGLFFFKLMVWRDGEVGHFMLMVHRCIFSGNRDLVHL